MTKSTAPMIDDVYGTAVEILKATRPDNYVDFLTDYSGRFMYGTTTPAIVYDGPVADVGAAVTAALLDMELNVEEFHVPTRMWNYIPTHSDQFGLHAQVYYEREPIRRR